MMNNKGINLSLKFNKSLQNLSMDGPYTPMEQTLKTPIDHTSHHNFESTPSIQQQQQQQQSFYFAGHNQANPKQESLYNHPHYNESDDILPDFDESNGNYRSTKSYTVAFTPNFDQLVMSIYNRILELPTTTPFSGIIPPSGLVSKVANETMANLITSTNNPNPPLYDHQSIINFDHLRNQSYHPIFLQLIRIRLIDLCTFNNQGHNNNSHNINGVTQQAPQLRLPETTSVSVTSSSGGMVMNNGVAGGAGLRQSSISNLSLTELNISNFNNGNASAARSRSSSMCLRKQSLTRNNSYSNNSWLHVGNINSIRPHSSGNNQEQFSSSTDSLQSIQDYVPQSFINRSAAANHPYSQSGYNSMMMDYQTPPSSSKGSTSALTPPNGPNGTQTANSDYEEFLFQQYNARSRSSSRGTNSFPRPLTINTECANAQALNALNGVTANTNPKNGNSQNALALDSPFMSATTPSEDYGYFSNGFGNMQHPGSADSSTTSSLSESPVNLNNGNNDAMLIDSSKINLPTQFSLSEKKRDSLKMKRGIH